MFLLVSDTIFLYIFFILYCAGAISMVVARTHGGVGGDKGGLGRRAHPVRHGRG